MFNGLFNVSRHSQQPAQTYRAPFHTVKSLILFDAKVNGARLTPVRMSRCNQPAMNCRKFLGLTIGGVAAGAAGAEFILNAEKSEFPYCFGDQP